MPRGKRRILVAMFQGGGNIPQILPIVVRLTDLGHRVRVVVGPGIRRDRLPVSVQLLESLDAAGVRVVPLGESSPHPLDTAPPARGFVGGWTPKFARFWGRGGHTALWAGHWAQRVRSELERERTDVVVADFFLVGALVAAEAVGVPSVVLAHSGYQRPLPGRPPPGPGWQRAHGVAGRLRDAGGNFVTSRTIDREALPALNRARAVLGLGAVQGFFKQYDKATRVLILASEHFDYPARRMPTNVRYVGTPLGEPAADPWYPPWAEQDDRPTVLVSLSSLQQGQASMLERALAALEALPVRALVTLGPALAAQRFERPPNVVFEPFVPHVAVLPQVQAMVTQCGLGTVMKALAHGVPLVCLPVLGDQPNNAARIASLGAGIRLPPDAAPDRIGGAIEQVIRDPSFRVAAQRFADNTRDEDPVREATTEIVALTGSTDA